MQTSDSDKELLIRNYYGCKANDIKSNTIFELISKSIDEMTEEEAREILRASKKYPENEDIDENKMTDVMKVIVRYIGRFHTVFCNFEYPHADVLPSAEFYTDRIKYYSTIIDELNGDDFTYSKLIVMLASEKTLGDYQELSACQGLALINDYIRKNIYGITADKLQLIVRSDISRRIYYSNKKRKSRGR